jgi:hypothetical protein
MHLGGLEEEERRQQMREQGAVEQGKEKQQGAKGRGQVAVKMGQKGNRDLVGLCHLQMMRMGDNHSSCTRTLQVACQCYTIMMLFAPICCN